MPCYQIDNASSGLGGQIGTTGFATEAECLEACKEGACCNGTTCTVKPQCQCNAAAGEVFKGVGTVCSPNPCDPCVCPQDGTTFPYPVSAVGSFSNITRIGGTLQLDPAIKADIESTTFPMEFYDLGFVDRLYVKRCLPSDPCGTICNELSALGGSDLLYAATGCAPSLIVPIGGVRFVKKCSWEFAITQQSSYANATKIQVPYWCNNSRNVIQSSSGSFFATLIPSGNVFDGTVTISGSLSIAFQQNPLP